MTAPYCRCGHSSEWHKHYSRSDHALYCSHLQCTCWKYKPERAWHRWRVFWRWSRPPRKPVPPAETIVIRPRPVPLPLPEQDGGDDKTRFDLRVGGYIDSGMRPRGMHHGRAPWEG